MMRWPASLRLRLTLWFTLVLGAPLVAFGAGSYALFARILHDRTDRFTGEALTAFARELSAERLITASPAAAAAKTVDEMRFRDLQIAVLDAEGRPLAVGRPVTELGDGEHAGLDEAAMLRAARASPNAPATLPDAAGGYRVITRSAVLDDAPVLLVAAYPLHEMQAMLDRMRKALLLGIPALLLTAALGGYFLARRSLAPVAHMAAQASHISATTLHERLPVETPGDELGGLAMVINGLLDRLDRAFQQQRRFMADASHELRTPTAILRTEADVTLARPTRGEDEYRASFAVVQEVSHRLTRLVDDLFLIARADAGHLVVRRAPTPLDEVMLEAVRAITPLAVQRGVHVQVDDADETPLQGDPDLLGRLALNLLDNAVKHSPTGGTVRVAVRSDGSRHTLSVVDEGPGIAEEARARIFERFFRADPARARQEGTDQGGAGLGLAIARHVAEAHGGTLELSDASPGHTEFRATFVTSDFPPAN